MNNNAETTPPSSTRSHVPKRRRKTIADDGAHSRPALDTPADSSPIIITALGSGGGGGGGGGAGSGTGGGSSSSPFRNVSACNRCRLRKNRCDQRLPACQSCEKAGVRCVGYDPITKREIPRSYVHYLETRVAYLESLLSSNSISFAAADEFPDLPFVPQITSPTVTPIHGPPPLPSSSSPQSMQPHIDPALQVQGEGGRESPKIKQEPGDVLEDKKLDSLVSDIGLVSFAGASDPRYLGSVSGISFARVVFAAVKSAAPGMNAGGNEYNGNESTKNRHRRVGSSNRVRGSRGLGMGGAATKEEPAQDEDADTQMRDSFFGLHTKPTISPAPFPTRVVAERLVNLYFEHANPQVPSLHRGEFSTVLDTIYGPPGTSSKDSATTGKENGKCDSYGGTARERYLLNIVCAIGSGIFLTGPDESSSNDNGESSGPEDGGRGEYGPRKKQKTESKRKDGRPKKGEPESYHASAMLQLEAFLSQSKGGLEELQAVLLLASYALLRPVSPGLWYIVGVAVRLAVDLGLHCEDAEQELKPQPPGPKTEKEGRKEWVRDMRRRLWWCVYSLDRLVSTCVGRPFGIADEVISTQFPSALDDQYIHPTKGLIDPPPGESVPSYKAITYHYFRLRLLQSEILQVLQQQSHAFSFASASSETAFKKDTYKGKQNYPLHHPYHLQTPYLHNHTSLQAWHRDVDRRLKEWIDTAPQSQEQTGVAFSPQFLELNYWQARIMLYRPCLSVPVLLASELSSNNGNTRSRAAERGLGGGAQVVRGRAEDEDRIYLIVAEAGTKVLRIYRQLHRVHQVNYTFLATHHLFMAGISFLYAIWHSPVVQSQLSMDEVDFTILAATSVLGDLVDKCPPAAACRDAFERMSRATVQMCLGGKRGPASAMIPSNTYRHSMAPAPPHQSVNTSRSEERQQQYRTTVYQPTHSPRVPQISSTQPHQPPHQQQQTLSRSSSADSYHQLSHTQAAAAAAAEAARRRQPVHFDEGFQELFTSPRAPQLTPPGTYAPQGHTTYVQSPTTTPTEGIQQYHPSVYANSQGMYSQQSAQGGGGDAEMMIDPALQQQRSGYIPVTSQSSGGGSEWGSTVDLSQLGFDDTEMWEHDNWSEEGGVGQVDLFDRFFFGGGT